MSTTELIHHAQETTILEQQDEQTQANVQSRRLPYQCHVCGARFATYDLLLEHKQEKNHW